MRMAHMMKLIYEKCYQNKTSNYLRDVNGTEKRYFRGGKHFAFQVMKAASEPLMEMIAGEFT